MPGPRDPAPVNNLTGEPVTPRQQIHLDNIQEAGEALYEAMHRAEGSNPPGEHQEHVFLSGRMKIAAIHLETALMFARKAALEAK